MYMKMEWHCPTVNYGSPNRIIIQLGNGAGLTEKIMQAYAIAFATSGGDSVSDVRELDYRNGIGNGILITSNHVDVWVNAVDSLNVTVNVEFVVWKP